MPVGAAAFVPPGPAPLDVAACEGYASRFKALADLGYGTIPSQANFIMFDVKRPVVPLIQALKQHNVQVGRLFPALPNHMRLTIGKKNEMEAFLSNFRDVMTG